MTFTYVTPPPTVKISYPVMATAYGTNWGGAISGTASSNFGSGTSITDVSVAVENTTTGKWLVGTSFTGTSQSFQTASGMTSWAFALLAKYLTSGDAYSVIAEATYSVIAEATDSVGNTGTSALVTFTYNCSPPSVAISYPVNNAKYGSTSWTGAITGTASSNAGAWDDDHRRLRRDREHDHEGLVERDLVQRHEPDLRRSERNDELVAVSAHEVPDFVRLLQRHRPGYKQPQERRHQLDGDLYLQQRLACLSHEDLNKVLRFCQAGPRVPSCLGHTTGTSLTGAPWQQAGTPLGSRQHTGANGFLGKGDVTIHRPYMAARPVGSDWRTRRPRLAVHLDEGAE